MAGKSDFLENLVIDGIFRGGCLTSAGAAGSTAVAGGGIWTASTAYTAGQIVVPHANMTGAGGKLLKCITAGTTSTTNNYAIGNPGVDITDGTAVFKVCAAMPSHPILYVALLTAAPSDSGGGTEVSGGSYARVGVSSSLANWSNTNTVGGTSSSSGSGGQTSNIGTITFPAPTANWGTVSHMGIYDLPSNGNLLYWAALTTQKTVNNGDAAPSFAAAALTVTED